MPLDPRIQDREFEEGQVIYAPAIVATGAVLSAVLWTTAGWFVLIGLLVVALGITRWVFESIKQGPELIPPHPEYYHEGDRWHHPSTYWWGAVVYSFLFASGFFAMIRVAQGHSLLDPSQGQLAMRDWMGHAAVATAVVVLVVAFFAARAGRSGRSIPGSLVLLSLAMFVLAGWMVAQAALIVQDPVISDTAPRLAALFWIHAFESIWLLVGAVVPLFVAPRAAKGHVRPQRFNVVSAVVLFPTIAVVQYLLFWLLIYLRVLQTSADLI